jgi:hypothetical protein
MECEWLEVAARILQPLDWKRIYSVDGNLQLLGGTKEWRLLNIFRF